MIPGHLVTFDRGMERLGVDEEGLQELIDSGALGTERYLGDVYLRAEEISARDGAREEKARRPAKQRAADDRKVQRIRDLLDSGVKEVGAAQVRELLGIGSSQVSKLAQEGRLNYEKRRGRTWYLLEDVETYARLQNVWASKAGRWTPYGKRDSKDPDSDMVRMATARDRRIDSSPLSDDDDYRIGIEQAAKILGISEVRVRGLERAGLLDKTKERRDTGRLDSRGRRVVQSVPTFSAREVFGLADRRERKRLRTCISPTAWNERMVRPFIRTTLEAPAGDRLISRMEAAAYLGVPVQKVTELVARGRLFGWQTHPGKQGCPLFLSERQVVRYGNDPDRLRRRASAFRGARPPSRLGRETEREIWMEDVGLAAGVRYAERSNVDRQHGEFLNSRQAAQALGIATRTLDGLRKRGRITGYQKPRKKADGAGQKWWFYRRTDIDELLLDREYRLRRDRGQAANKRAMGRSVEEE